MPQTFWEAMSDINWGGWKCAMDKEMECMDDFGVWKLVPLPVGKNLMSCKWVFSIKRDMFGQVDRLKARLTCRGFTQREGRDFGATWAPTCRMRVFRAMMAEASSNSAVETRQWDMTCAFFT